MIKRWLLLDDFNTLLIGPRRAGKTTYLKQNYTEYNYQTLDDLDILSWARSDPKGLIQSLGKKFIIDEIQREPALTIAVKYAIDEHEAKVVLTGSSSIGLLDQSADSLAGRINIRHLPTVCWGEDNSGPNHSIFSEEMGYQELRDARRSFADFLHYGGFPEILMQESNEQKEEVLKRYRDTYFVRDLLQLANIENVNGLHAIYNHLAKSVCSTVEVSNFASEANLSHQTAKKYINVLLQSDLAFSLQGYQYGPAKRYIKAAKIYFSDIGILNSLNTRVSEGQLVENFVISEIEKRRKLGFIKCDNLYYYKSTSGAEVDLIFEEGNTVYAIEIKSKSKITGRDLANLKKFEVKNKQVKKFVFYTGEDYKQLDSITILPVCSLYCGR